jgi:hypothetical protein
MGGFSVAHPLLLVGLAALPLLWWWLRALPPRPAKIAFPALLLIRNAPAIVSHSRPPLWLIVMRMVLVVLLILAASAPAWKSSNISNNKSDLIIIVDNGWEGATALPRASELAATTLSNMRNGSNRVAILETAEPPGADTTPGLTWLSPDVAEGRLRTLSAQPWSPNRAKFLESYGPLLKQSSARMLWLSDGLNPESANQFAQSFTPGQSVSAERLDEHGPIAFRNVVSRSEGFVVEIIALPRASARTFQILARRGDGKIGGSVQALLRANVEAVTVTLEIAPTERTKISRLEIAGQASAAATFLLDDSMARPLIGINSSETVEERQPLRSGNFYLRRALETQADVREGGIDSLLDIPVNMLILNDIGAIPAVTQTRLKKWLDAGGLLVLFAGPRMAETGSPFAPVALRPSSRTMGGALTWGKPVNLAPFPANSPFSGIAIDEKISIVRQVLAEPSPDLTRSSWASLVDTTPLITAKQTGSGLTVLFHTTAGPAWTDLPLSGMFEQMLRRLVPMAGRTAAVGERPAGSYTLETALLGDGTLASPVGAVQPMTPDMMAEAVASPATPPGYYRSGTRIQALNLASPNGPIGPRYQLEAITRWPNNITQNTEKKRLFQFAPLLWQLALILLVADAIGTLLVRRRLPRLSMRSPALAIFVVMLILPSALKAAPPPGALDVRLGYVSGNLAARVDSQSGLLALNDALLTRTAIRPGPPQAVFPGRDPMGFYTLIYWPVPANAAPLDGPAALAVSRYLEVGGLILLDTANAGNTPATRAQASRRMLSSLSLPRLEQLSDAHVLSKSFYLLGRGPAQPLLAQLWVEADTRGGDGKIGGLIIGNQNLVSALTDASLDSVRREAAIRLGINAVMYALTGTYKADQVHAESLLDRMQENDIQIRRIGP